MAKSPSEARETEPQSPRRRISRWIWASAAAGVAVIGLILAYHYAKGRHEEPLKEWVQEQNFVFLVPARSDLMPGDILQWPDAKRGVAPSGDAQLFERSAQVLGPPGETDLVTGRPFTVVLTGTIEAGMRAGALNPKIGAEASAAGAESFELTLSDVEILEVPLATLQQAIARNVKLAEVLKNPNRTAVARILRPRSFEYRFGNSGSTGFLAKLGSLFGVKDSSLESGGKFKTAMKMTSTQPMVIGVALARLDPFAASTGRAGTEVQPLNFEQSRTFQGDSNAALWPEGSTIKVRFLDGSVAQQQLFKEALGEWLKYANLKVAYVSSRDADVRVEFGPNIYENWSYVGRMALRTDPTEPTITLGHDVTSPNARGGYLHEIGHALGLVHEFQNPRAAQIWNRSALYAYADQVGWGRDYVDTNILNSTDYPGARELDLHTVMAYPLPASLTKAGKTFQPGNDLSESDRAYIASLYPATNSKD